ncbi:MAG: PBSX family phage terminase large subunit [Phycisphaeraceae bacterium]|nr:PBSX family phage terminase large subunit [Phycisphaeraceae bacterium]
MTSTPTLNPALRGFWRKPARNRILYGGRSSSKSWDAAGFAVFLASNYKVRFLCARQFQNKIAESVYTLLKIQIKRFGLEDEFKILDNSITHRRTGSEFLFYGLWRHIDEIKSLEGIDVCWIEEAQGLTQHQWDVLEPTLRGEGSQFWIIFNPRLVTDFVYRKFVTNTPTDTIKRKINYTENPFLSSTILKVIAAKKSEDEDEYRHIYLGEPLQDDDQAIIKRSWINAAIDAHKVLGIGLSGRKRVGFDVADSGKDKNSLVMVHGIAAIRVDEWKGREDELLKSASRVHAVARIARAEIDYDSIGIGAYAGSHFKALNEEKNCSIPYFKFNAGGEVLNKDRHIDPDDIHSPLNVDFYSNVKAQAWWEVGIRFKNTFNAVTKDMKFDEAELISLSSDCAHLETLIDELATPLRDFDTHGKAKVESKKDLAKRDIPSPNNADAFIMANAPRATVPRAQITQIGGLY